jgi:hypothetical protein
MRRPLLGMLFALACVSIFSFPSTAGAITLTSHVVKPHGITEKADRHVVLVRTVAPADSDDDGVADSADKCPNTAGPDNGCPVSEPTPTAASTPYVAPAPTTSSVASSTAGMPPESIAQCESGGSYTAVNPSSGAYGKWQILPSTSAAYGCDMSSPAGQDACAASIYADVGSSAWSCG